MKFLLVLAIVAALLEGESSGAAFQYDCWYETVNTRDWQEYQKRKKTGCLCDPPKSHKRNEPIWARGDDHANTMFFRWWFGTPRSKREHILQGPDCFR